MKIREGGEGRDSWRSSLFVEETFTKRRVPIWDKAWIESARNSHGWERKDFPNLEALFAAQSVLHKSLVYMEDTYAYFVQCARRNHKVLERIDPEGERRIHKAQTAEPLGFSGLQLIILCLGIGKCGLHLPDASYSLLSFFLFSSSTRPLFPRFPSFYPALVPCIQVLWEPLSNYP